MTRKFYFTITLPQKIKQKQTPFPELYYEDCRYIKKASSYETDHFDCDAPQGRRTTACLPEHPPVPVNIITSGLLSIYLFIYLFIFNPVNESGASEKVIKKLMALIVPSSIYRYILQNYRRSFTLLSQEDSHFLFGG